MTAVTTVNAAVLGRLHEACNSGDPDLIRATIDELVAPDAVVRTPLPIDGSGPEVLKEVFTRLVRAFPDLHIHKEDLIAAGDKVVCRNTVTGTHRGEHLGIPPTGRSVSYREIFIFRLAGGRIVETWGVVDVLSQLQQLGAGPVGRYGS